MQNDVCVAMCSYTVCVVMYNYTVCVAMCNYTVCVAMCSYVCVTLNRMQNDADIIFIGS